MTEKANLKRRQFLLTAGVGGVSAAAAVVAVRSSGSDAGTTGTTGTTAQTDRSGYRMTEHIAAYYRTARV
jgi:hypothetical protein